MTGTAPSGRRRRSRRLATVVGAVVLVLVAAVAAVAPGASAGPAADPGRRRAPTVTGTHLIVASATDPATGGYWLAATDGGVFSFGAPFEGSAGALPLRSPVVGMAATADGLGYRLVAADGGVFAYGDAAFLGSMGGLPLNRPVVGMAATPDGQGYWLVASRRRHLRLRRRRRSWAPWAATPLNRPIVGMAPTADGKGYWLVASDGGVFAYGDAAFLGSTGALTLASPVVGMAADAPVGRLPAGGGRRRGVLLRCTRSPDRRWACVAPGRRLGRLRRAPATGSCRPTARSTPSAEPRSSARSTCPRWWARWSPSTPATTAATGPIRDSSTGRSTAAASPSPATRRAPTDAAGYPEHAFNFDVATRLAALLDAGGATVVLTRYTDTGVGPCVNTRAAIGNAAGSDAAVSIHGDGGPVGGQRVRRRRAGPGGQPHQRQPGHRGAVRASSAPTCATGSWPTPASTSRTTPASTGSSPAPTSAASTSRRSRRS